MDSSSAALKALLDTDLFKAATHRLNAQEQVQVSVAKSRAIASAYRKCLSGCISCLTLEDIATLSPKFWAIHSHPMIWNDGATTTMLTIQLNLVIGTILDNVGERPDLRDMLQNLLEFKVWGLFCLTEVDHGLDVANIETTATALDNGSGYMLHTPHSGAAKFMAPTIPCGPPTVGLVFARLIKRGTDLGLRPFLVPLNDGKSMRPGIVARSLPYRGGSAPVPHAITSFDHVYIPRSALLVRPTATGKAGNQNTMMRRPAVGTLSMSALAIPALARTASTTALYSQRRLVGPKSQTVPIISFPTQQKPILVAFAQSFVLAEFFKRATRVFNDDSVDFRVRHGIAVCFKAVSMGHAEEGMHELAERCGAQGLFNHNSMSEVHADLRGIGTAEGDTLVLSIRLATELILNRYSLDSAFFASCAPSNSPLAHHAYGLLSACRATLAHECGGAHRSSAFGRLILPRCRALIEAIGMNYAYASAVSAGVDERISKLYLAHVMRADEGWYIENLQLKQDNLCKAEASALEDALPELRAWMARSGTESYAREPIVGREQWLAFVGQLKVFGGMPQQTFRRVEMTSKL
ncbi:acyl-CoA dehydrogenase NM domain-like protein [Mycena capillaripes]|nr:acyl-CoA dehydrogenase NM domain-like protein [Mycena capillaripes]